ncbi:MAG: nucleotidyltransferase domain-containing protein [candidate division KSB1 bacterium]|nr:nucleotidyltransferase domain-containing protein [candidate division KSB1 bacterium]
MHPKLFSLDSKGVEKILRMKSETNKLLERIKAILNDYSEVTAAYLFGSRAEGYQRQGSDVDIAILVDSRLDKMRTFSLQLDLGDVLERKLKRQVDLLVLNHAPLAIAFRAVKGILILERNPTERALFESRILSRYYDYRRFLRFHLKALYHRIKEGKFAASG